MKKKYRVYLCQINQQYYDVEANGRTAAESKVRKMWKRDNEPQVIAAVQRDDEA